MAAVRVTASKGATKKTGKALGFRMERAQPDGTFTSHTEFAPTPRKKGAMSGMESWKPEPPTTHADLKSVHDHIDQHFGDGGKTASNNDADD